MLTLTRKVGETIRIGNDIEVVVKEIRKNQVRISIRAPREVKIYREEVYDNTQQEKRAARMKAVDELVAETEALGLYETSEHFGGDDPFGED